MNPDKIRDEVGIPKARLQLGATMPQGRRAYLLRGGFVFAARYARLIYAPACPPKPPRRHLATLR